MRAFDVFFEKVIKNDVLVKNLDKLKGEVWWNLSFKQRKKIFEIVLEEICSFYPELGKPKFDFVVLEEGQSGEEGEEGTYLNVTMLEEGNYFEILATCLHELRHYYQRIACKLYEDTGKVHELFTKEEIEAFNENLAKSKLLRGHNYIQSSDMDMEGYTLQPIEYDAENFSYEFMKRFSKRFLKDSDDIINCESANLGFRKTKRIKESGEFDIIDFSKVYFYEYKELVENNRVLTKLDEIKYEKYMKILDKMDYLDDEGLFSLLNPGLIETYSEETMVSLLNAYLKYNGSETRVIKDNDGHYYNGLLINVKDSLIYRVMEPLFLQVAKEKIEKITKQDMKSLNNRIEKDVKVNLMKKENLIEEKKHPLLYRLQPYMIYRDMVVRQEYMKLIRGVDNAYPENNSFFDDFVTYIKKYDYVQLSKKAEILLGKKFEEIYDEMVSKMNNNINKEGKTI